MVRCWSQKLGILYVRAGLQASVVSCAGEIYNINKFVISTQGTMHLGMCM